MGNNCCVSSEDDHQFEQRKTFNILLLGLSGAGKTEIGYKLINTIRKDYSRTNGVRTFKRRIDDINLNITEIGGSEQMQKIWSHYFVKAMGLIYTIDVSAHYSQLRRSLDILNEILHDKYMAGKPVIFFATKIDEMSEDLTFFDLNEILGLECLANQCRSYMQLETVALTDIKILYTSLNWIIAQIRENYQIILNRIEFDTEDAKENRFPVASYKERSLIRSARMAIYMIGNRAQIRPHSTPAAALRRTKRVARTTTKRVRVQDHNSNVRFKDNYFL